MHSADNPHDAARDSGRRQDALSAQDARAQGTDDSPRHSLLREVRARLAAASDELVIGSWRPWQDVLVLAVGGEMDMSNAAQLTQTLEGRLEEGCQLIV